MPIEPGKDLLPFEAILDAWLLRKNEAERKEWAGLRGTQRDHFYMSELGYGHRKIFLSFIPEIERDESKTGQNMRVFANGNYVQKRYSDWFKAMGVWVAEEVPLNTYDREDCPIKVSGRIDLIIDYYKFYGLYMELVQEGRLDPVLFPLPDAPPPKEGDKAIIEMKSINSWGFKDKEKTGSPEAGHLYQLSMYQWLSGINIGFVLYEEKDRQQVGAFPVVFDERLIYGDGTSRLPGLLKEFAELGRQIEARELPEKCPGAQKSKFPCKWGTGQCDFYNFCWESNEVVPTKRPDNEVEVDGMKIILPKGAKPQDVDLLRRLLAGATVSNPKENAEIDSMMSSLPGDGRPATVVDYVAQMQVATEAFKTAADARETATKSKRASTRKTGAAGISETLAGHSGE